MSHIHPYHTLRLPPDVSFQLRPSPGKGWGAFATIQIPLGALILRDGPLFTISKHHNEISADEVLMTFQNLTGHEKELYLLLREDTNQPFESQLLEVFRKNQFVLTLPNASKTAPGIDGVGVYLLHSRFNHSCAPNAMVPHQDSTKIIEMYVNRNIAVGEEITFCYRHHFECSTRPERIQSLGFDCLCAACRPGTTFQLLSDMRRQFIGAIEYLIVGEDSSINGKAQQSIIISPLQREVARNRSIPMSTRIVYFVLAAFLLEQEGLLDHCLGGVLERCIERMINELRTASNFRIARLAMRQNTWLKKLDVAFSLWRRVDENDLHFIARLRMGDTLANTRGNPFKN